MSGRLSYSNPHGFGSILQAVLVSSAPIYSAAGAILACRICLQNRNGCGELAPLLGPLTGYYDKETHCQAAAQDLLCWPHAMPQQPPPLSGESSGQARSPPFRAIFSTQLPKSPRSALAEKTPPLGLEEPGAVL